MKRARDSSSGRVATLITTTSMMVIALSLVWRQADAFASLTAIPGSVACSSSASSSSSSSIFNGAVRRTKSRVAPRSMARPWSSMAAGLPDSPGLSAATTDALSDLREGVGEVIHALLELRESLGGESLIPFLPKVELLDSLLSSPSPKQAALTKLLDLPDTLSSSEFFSSALNLAQEAGLRDLSKQLSRAAFEAASAAAGLPLSPEKLKVLLKLASRASAQTSSRVSQALDALAVENPALASPVAHLESFFSHALAALEHAYAEGVALVPEAFHPAVAILALGAASTALGFSFGAAREGSQRAAEEKNAPLPREYDLPAIMSYYNGRPLTLFGRLLEVSSRLGSLGGKLWLDRKVGDGAGWERNMQARAEEFVEFLQGAGPAFIKIGQGVSIRPDILPEAYLRELAKLQDRVKPFDSAQARAILASQLGRPLGEVFLDADTAFESTVAAASLGQVYRATLLTGETVAVKVQRPDVLESVTLDLYVIRLLLLFLSKWDGVRDSALSILGVIDNWADRFLQELDYLKEAANGDRFRVDMAASKTLGEAIVVPQVFVSLTSRYVLVTEWIEGVKVDAIDASTDAGRERLKKVVATLLNSYLAQLLESGFLHADPHPGNFLCTPDGKLCVLDMGLMTEVTEDQRYALLEYVSHLTAKDYEATLNDLIVLGFIPKEIGEDPEKAGIVAPLLATVLEQLSNGGGAKAVTVESVGTEVEELGRQYPIVIPAYFGLIIRAFSALEGLGLQLDPKYSIVNECFPYLARRLLTEDSERMHKMLRTFLYGKEGRYLKVDRVDEIVHGYSRFTALAAEASEGVSVDGVRDPLGRLSSPSSPETPSTTAAAPTVGRFGSPGSEKSRALDVSSARRSPSPEAVFGGGGGGGRTSVFAAAGSGLGVGVGRGGERGNADPIEDPVARDALKLLFSKEGNYVQELVVEELVRMTDALSREANLQIIEALRTLTEAPLSPARIAKALAEAPLNPLLAPLQVTAKAQAFTLSRVFGRLEVAMELTQEDQESLKALRRLRQLLQGGIDGALGTAGGSASPGGSSSSSGSGSGGGGNPLEGLPLPLPFPIPALAGGVSRLLPGDGGGAVGPREAVDAARQTAGLASMIGPGMFSIAQKFATQLAARTLDRLADSFDEQQNSLSPDQETSVPSSPSRFYAED